MSIDERLDAIAMNLELMSERSVEMEERAERAEERHNHEMAAIRAELRRGIRLSIQDARAERSKRQKLESTFDQKITQLAAAQLVTEEKLQQSDDKITQLAAAQLVTEEKLQRFLDRGNGKSS